MKRPTHSWSLPLALLLLAGSLPGLACKSGDPVSGALVPATPDFAEAAPPQNVTDHLVSVRKGTIAGGRIMLDIVITEVSESVSGVAIKLTYPDTFSRFISCSDGNLFSTGDCFFAEPAPGSGEVFIGRSVSGANQSAPVSGEKIAVRLEFLVFGEGSGPITFEGQNLGGGDASAVLDENGDPIFMQWVSGMLIGQ